MGFQSAFGDSGVILGMASGAVLAVGIGWQYPFVLWGGVNLLAVAIGLALARGRSSPPPPGQALARNYLEVLRDVRLWLLPLAVGGAVFNIFSFFGPLLLYGKFGVPKDLAGVAVALWILAGIMAAAFAGSVAVETSVPFSLAAALAFFGFVLLVMVRGQAGLNRRGVRSAVPPL